MVGYSDSRKDAGNVAASWALYESQEAMRAVADAKGVELTFFHGKVHARAHARTHRTRPTHTRPHRTRSHPHSHSRAHARSHCACSHGKGGTVGRGGNPALYRAVLAHPPGTIQGRFRVTEQGEMITQNFGSPEIAERTLDIYTVTSPATRAASVCLVVLTLCCPSG